MDSSDPDLTASRLYGSLHTFSSHSQPFFVLLYTESWHFHILEMSCFHSYKKKNTKNEWGKINMYQLEMEADKLNAFFNNSKCSGRVWDKMGLRFLGAIMRNELGKNSILTAQRDCHPQSRLPSFGYSLNPKRNILESSEICLRRVTSLQKFRLTE